MYLSEQLYKSVETPPEQFDGKQIILNSDRIYVVDNGSIVDEGNHDDLIKNSKIYKNFYEKQLRKD